MTAFLCLLLTISACNYLDKIRPVAHTPQASKVELLESKYKAEIERYSDVSADALWPSETDCDAVLWASLASSSIPLDSTRSLAPDGRLYRRPSKDCYQKGESRSSVSNDMIVGFLWASFMNGLKSELIALKNYAEANKFVMGEPWPDGVGEVLMKPQVQGIMGRLLVHFEESAGDYQDIRLPYLPSPKDYVRHIQTLMIALDGELTGYITGQELELLKKYQKEDPDDYLISAVVCKYNNCMGFVVDMLLEDLPAPSYVRGDNFEAYRTSHWLFSAKYVLNHIKDD